MLVDQFDFDLPPERIALRPARPRDAARLLTVDPNADPQLEDRQVRELSEVLDPGDMLVFNDTRVIPARLSGYRVNSRNSRAKIEITLHKRINDNDWFCFAKPARKIDVGDRLIFASEQQHGGDQENLEATVAEKLGEGECRVAFSPGKQNFGTSLESFGEVPLPPYIASRRALDDEDLSDYQTIFAARDGAVAAPTAGLHFTDELISRLNANDIACATITLHVGAGTFLPVKVRDIRDHKMHKEWGEITPDLARKLNEVKARGGRIVAVGTTVMRLLESAADDQGVVHPFSDDTDIFISPGYRFKCVDILMTNFHLPKSTLFMLVCAFSGTETMKKAYNHAIENAYRFYSYGDACLLFPETRRF